MKIPVFIGKKVNWGKEIFQSEMRKNIKQTNKPPNNQETIASECFFKKILEKPKANSENSKPRNSKACPTL